MFHSRCQKEATPLKPCKAKNVFFYPRPASTLNTKKWKLYVFEEGLLGIKEGTECVQHWGFATALEPGRPLRFLPEGALSECPGNKKNGVLQYQ